MSLGTCEVCGKSVDSHWNAARYVVGWEPLRSGGGTNHLIDREPDDTRIGHKTCLEARARRRRRGIHDGQSELL